MSLGTRTRVQPCQMQSPLNDATIDRKFGYWTGHFVVVASMIGAGILLTSGYTLKDTGNPLALLGLWALGGLLALCGAVTVAELATALPRSGGDYVFVDEAYGRGAAIVSGWATFVIGFAAPTAVVARGSLEYLTAPFSKQLTDSFGPTAVDLVVQLGASVLVIFVAIVHSLGARQSTWLQVTATIIKMTILLAIAIGGILFGTGDWSHLSAGKELGRSEWTALAIGLIYVGYAYSGWNGAAYIAGEIKDPARFLPRCLIFGTLTVIALYMLVNLAYVYALDPAWMQSLSFGKDEERRQIQRVAETAVDAMFGRGAANVVAVAIGLSLVASVSAYVLTGPRVAFAMARNGVFPGYAGRLHPTRLTPMLAIASQTVLAIALIWSGTFRELLEYTSIGLAVVSALTVASVFPIRRRTDLPHPYRMPLYPLPPLFFLSLTIWTVGYTVYNEVFKDGQFQLLKDGQIHRPGPALLSLLTFLVAIPLAYLVPGMRRGR